MRITSAFIAATLDFSDDQSFGLIKSLLVTYCAQIMNPCGALSALSSTACLGLIECLIIS